MDFTFADMDGDEAIAAYACDMVVQKKADIPMTVSYTHLDVYKRQM